MKLLILTIRIEGFKITFLYRWETRQGRDKKTGSMIAKNIKMCILDATDLRSAFCAFSQTSPTEAIELFFKLSLRGSGKTGVDDTPPPPDDEYSTDDTPPRGPPDETPVRPTPTPPPRGSLLALFYR